MVRSGRDKCKPRYGRDLLKPVLFRVDRKWANNGPPRNMAATVTEPLKCPLAERELSVDSPFNVEMDAACDQIRMPRPLILLPTDCTQATR